MVGCKLHRECEFIVVQHYGTIIKIKTLSFSSFLIEDQIIFMFCQFVLNKCDLISETVLILFKKMIEVITVFANPVTITIQFDDINNLTIESE